MDDVISRRAVLDKFEPWLKVKDYNDGELNMLKAILYEIRFMPPATDKLGTNLAEVGTDCISRQAAIDYFVTNVGFHDEDGYPIEDECELREIWTGYFDGIPSAQPEPLKIDLSGYSEEDWERLKKEWGNTPITVLSAQPKRGRWERHYSRPNVYADLFWHCSECGYRSSDNWADKFNFCPNCGTDMRGEQDG